MPASRLHRALAGEDGPQKRALPAGELLHPIPLLAVAVLLLNDHVLKGAGWLPAVVTGKLSDLAGLLFFPLLLTSVADTALLLLAGLLRTRWNFSLTRAKLAAAVAATGALFVAIKLSAGAAAALADVLGKVGFDSAIVADPTDLVALPMLALAYWLGRNELRRVPLGRIAVLERRWRADRTPSANGLRDVVAAGADAATVRALATALDDYFAGGDPQPARDALARLR